MPTSYPTDQERRAVDHLIRCMDKYSYGSEEYELARRAFAFICEKVRREQKLNENIE